MQDQIQTKPNKLERAHYKLASYISSAVCVLIKWSIHKDGLEYSIFKKEYCYNYNIQASSDSIKVTCTVKHLDQEHACELIKIGIFILFVQIISLILLINEIQSAQNIIHFKCMIFCVYKCNICKHYSIFVYYISKLIQSILQLLQLLLYRTTLFNFIKCFK